MSGNIAIITARGGSKRIPRKNIKNFLGKPIISYSISAALNSRIFDEVMVSTDDDEIADIAIKYGARVPFFRSSANSDDFSTTADVLSEVLAQYHAQNQFFKFCCCIYPTAPFVNVKKLKDGLRLLEETGADSVFPVTIFGYPIQRALKMAGNRLQMIDSQYLNSRSQDLSPAYHDAGQFYWFDISRFQVTGRLFSDYSVPIIVPELEVQDIDTAQDWKLAELKYKLTL